MISRTAGQMGATDPLAGTVNKISGGRVSSRMRARALDPLEACKKVEALLREYSRDWVATEREAIVILQKAIDKAERDAQEGEAADRQEAADARRESDENR